MELIANRQLTGDYGSVSAGDCFHCSEEVGAQLLQAGLARVRFAQPYIYETKVVTPEAPEVKPAAAIPFRDVPDSDPRPKALVALESAVRAASDAPEERNTRRIQRRKR